MKIGNLNTSAAAQRGAFLHLKNPFTGLLMYQGPEELVDPATGNLRVDYDPEGVEEVGIHVLGFEAPDVRKVMKELERGVAKAKAMGRDPMPEEEIGIRTAASMIVGFVHLYDDDGKLLEAPRDCEDFVRCSDNIIAQIMAFARRNRNFLPRSYGEPS